MASFAPIIEEAWEHRRRRHQALGAAVLAAAATAGIVFAIAAMESGPRYGSRGSARAITVAPSAVLSRAPYLGVSCPAANSIACDRVGLAVWLKRPAVSVTATIAGAHLSMNYRGDVLHSGTAPRSAFDGFLQPAGIVSRLHVQPVEGSLVYTTHGHVRVAVRHEMWFGAGDTPAVAIRLTIHDAGGRMVITHTKVQLATGWG